VVEEKDNSLLEKRLLKRTTSEEKKNKRRVQKRVETKLHNEEENITETKSTMF